MAPTQINNAGLTNPWPIPNNIAPSIPTLVLENIPNTSKKFK
jgi:hypothetical protein